MSVAVISYHSLGNAASEAKSVATKLTRYADNLNSVVYKKLSNYSGDYSDNIQTAKMEMKSKMNALREKASAYTNYADDLSELKSRCSDTDRSVKAMVSQLTGQFKAAHEIHNSFVANTINYFLTKVSNSTAAGRWISDGYDQVESVKDYIRQSLKDMWNYEGGKELFEGIAAAVCMGVIGMCMVAGAIAALLAAPAIWPAIVGMAKLILGSIMVVNAYVNGVNESRAYTATINGDPAMGRRLSDENTLQDTIRRETDSQYLHNFAANVDMASVVCGVITSLDGAGKLLKNFYKWTTGSMTELSKLNVKDILTKDNFKEMMKGAKNNLRGAGSSLSANAKNLLSTLKSGGFKALGQSIKSGFGTDLLNNLQKSYADFSSMKGSAGTVANIAGTINNMADGVSPKDFIQTVLKNTTIGRVTTYDSEKGGGILSYNDSPIFITDFTGILDNAKSLVEHDAFKNHTTIDKKLLNKLSENCSVNISALR